MDVRTTFLDKLAKDREGHYALFAKPNTPLIIAIAASLAGRILTNLAGGVAQFMALGMWFTWSWLEITTGVNYFRRALGLIVLLGLLYTNIHNGRF